LITSRRVEDPGAAPCPAKARSSNDDAAAAASKERREVRLKLLLLTNAFRPEVVRISMLFDPSQNFSSRPVVPDFEFNNFFIFIAAFVCIAGISPQGTVSTTCVVLPQTAPLVGPAPHHIRTFSAT
jgi:hypothetical protein